MTVVHTISIGGKRVFVAGPPPQVPEEAPSRGSLRALLAGVPIHRDELRALSLDLEEIETQCKIALHDAALLVMTVEVIAATVKDAMGRFQ
jgi:hypothetical protein